MSNVQEKVQNLITLAIDPGATPNESRNAALKAVQLIEKHELLYEDTTELDALKKQNAALRKQLDAIAKIIDRRPQHVHVVVPDPPSEEFRRNREWSAGQARFGGRMCPECGKPIAEGDFIATRRVSDPTKPDAFHLGCFNKRQREGRI